MLSSLSEIAYSNRKRLKLVYCCVLFAAVSCSSFAEPKSSTEVVGTPIVRASNTPTTTDSAKQVAARLTELYENNDCKGFFDVFPSNFEQFNRLYGFDDNEGGRALYAKYEKHIPYFYDCPDVSDLDKLKKSIEIGIDGKWEADASSLVQDSTFKLVRANPNEAKDLLDKMSNQLAASFWHFMFDGPHPNDKENVRKFELLVNLLGRESNQAKLLSEQFQKLRVSKH